MGLPRGLFFGLPMKLAEPSELVPAGEELFARLKRCTDLPTPSGVAARIIDLGQDPDADLGQVADAVSVDPALTAKIMRIANSALYTRQRQSENLRQALTKLGLNATLTLALTFSLVTTLRTKAGHGMDHALFWRRSIIAATACRTLAIRLGLGSGADFFLSGLLQDIGMLAIDKVAPECYAQIGARQSEHDYLQSMERELLGVDHADAGAWLLQNWNLPEPLVRAVAGSHDPQGGGAQPEPSTLCAAVAGAFADIWCAQDGEATQRAAALAGTLLDVDRERFCGLLDSVAAEMQETGAVFEINIGDPATNASLLEQAKEVLMVRNLESMQEATRLHQITQRLEARTRELEELSQRDGLTGLYNRTHLDQVLTEEFLQAKRHAWPLSIAFIDLDHFKKINDSHGHQFGDRILQSVARLLLSATRSTDTVARYGGEEFVVVLPGTGAQAMRAICERILAAFQAAHHDVPGHGQLSVSASIGGVTHDESTPFERVTDLLQAADEALYTAKHQGRARCVVHGRSK